MADVQLNPAPDAAATPREADSPRDSLVARFGPDKPLKLDAGVELSPFQIAYKTYGALNAEGSDESVSFSDGFFSTGAWLQQASLPMRPYAERDGTQRYRAARRR